MAGNVLTVIMLKVSCALAVFNFILGFFLLNQGNTLHRGETEETDKLKQFADMEGSHTEEGKVPDDEAVQTVEVKLPADRTHEVKLPEGEDDRTHEMKLPAGEDYQTKEMKQPDDWSDPRE